MVGFADIAMTKAVAQRGLLQSRGRRSKETRKAKLDTGLTPHEKDAPADAPTEMKELALASVENMEREQRQRESGGGWRWPPGAYSPETPHCHRFCVGRARARPLRSGWLILYRRRLCVAEAIDGFSPPLLLHPLAPCSTALALPPLSAPPLPPP